MNEEAGGKISQVTKQLRTLDKVVQEQKEVILQLEKRLESVLLPVPNIKGVEDPKMELVSLADEIRSQVENIQYQTEYLQSIKNRLEL